ncbi:MAG: SCP2 sterol-binding domain-containing protein [Gallionella sp.]
MFTQTSAAALNHLLSQNSWALSRLARHAGKTARFDIAPLAFAYTILDDGKLRAAGAATEPDALCVIAPSLLPRLALSDENAFREIHSEGDEELLKEIFFLSRNLDWDIADDLSHVTGDIAAERIVQSIAAIHRGLRDAASSLAHAAAEYWTEERPLLAKPQQVSAFIHQVDMLRDDAARLEQRIKALSPSPPAPPPFNGEGSRR